MERIASQIAIVDDKTKGTGISFLMKSGNQIEYVNIQSNEFQKHRYFYHPPHFVKPKAEVKINPNLKPEMRQALLRNKL